MTDRQIAGIRDALDEQLIALLLQNARMTLTALSQKLSLSRTAVQARMARLERDKVIIGYRAVIGERRDGREDEGLSAVLSVTFGQKPFLPVVDKFRLWPEVTNCYFVTGPVDAYVMVKVDTAQDLSRLLDRLTAIPGVASVQSAVVLKAGVG